MMLKLIILLLVLPTALADVHFASDLDMSGGEFSAYSEGVDHKLSAHASGDSEYSLVADLADASNSTVWQGINATRGSCSVRSPEYDLRIRDASGLYVTASLARESTTEEMEEIITEVDNGSLVQTTITTYTDAAIGVTARGNGMLSEDISVAYHGKARALKLRELDANGSFNLTTKVGLSGASVFKGFSMLNETEAFDKTIMAADDESGTGAMGYV